MMLSHGRWHHGGSAFERERTYKREFYNNCSLKYKSTPQSQLFQGWYVQNLITFYEAPLLEGLTTSTLPL
jgi:hypothetical protein